jgi:hypothetical protein
LDPDVEYLFMLDRKPNTTVHDYGIRVQLSRFETGFYFDDTGIVGGLLAENARPKVTMCRSPDITEHIFIEHPGTGQILKIPRQRTHRRTATPEQLKKARASRRAFITGALGEMGNVENIATSYIIRDHEFSELDRQRGRQMKQANAQAGAEQSVADCAWQEYESLLQKLDKPVPTRHTVHNLATRLEGVRAQHARKQSQAANTR